IITGYRNSKSGRSVLKLRDCRLGGTLCTSRVIRVRALHGIVTGREIRYRPRHRPKMIEACHKRKCTRSAEPAVWRLEAEYSAQRVWHRERAVGVGPKCQRT